MKKAGIFFVLFFLLFPSEAGAFSDLVRRGKVPPECFYSNSNGGYLLITGDKYREYEWRETEQALVATHHRRRLEISLNPDGKIWIVWENSQCRTEVVNLEFRDNWLEFSCAVSVQRKNNEGVLESPETFESDGEIERGGAWEEHFKEEMGVERGDSWERWIFDKRILFFPIKVTFYYRGGCLVAVDY